MLYAPPPPPVARLATIGEMPRYFLHISGPVTLRRRHRYIRISFNVVNRGADPHNMTIRRLSDGLVVGASGLVQPISRTHQAVTFAVTLPRGRYVLYCSLTTGGSHERRGMRTIFVVRRPRRHR